MELALLLDPDNALSRYNFACTGAAFLNDVDLAVDLLKPVLCGDSAATFAKFAMRDPDLEQVRNDERFAKIIADVMQRFGIADPSLAGSP